MNNWKVSKQPATQLSKKIWQKGIVENNSLRSTLVANVFGQTKDEVEAIANKIVEAVNKLQNETT